LCLLLLLMQTRKTINCSASLAYKLLLLQLGRPACALLHPMKSMHCWAKARAQQGSQQLIYVTELSNSPKPASPKATAATTEWPHSCCLTPLPSLLLHPQTLLRLLTPMLLLLLRCFACCMYCCCKLLVLRLLQQGRVKPQHGKQQVQEHHMCHLGCKHSPVRIHGRIL
jgi:hypothetical protein